MSSVYLLEYEVVLEDERECVVVIERIYPLGAEFFVNVIQAVFYLIHLHLSRRVEPHSARDSVKDIDHITHLRVNEYSWYRFVEDLGRYLDSFNTQ